MVLGPVVLLDGAERRGHRGTEEIRRPQPRLLAQPPSPGGSLQRVGPKGRGPGRGGGNPQDMAQGLSGSREEELFLLERSGGNGPEAVRAVH